MACISDIPVELLVNIFLLAVFACDGEPALRDAPWSISQVCRLWRSITLEDGRIWAHLSLFRVDELLYEDEVGRQRLIGPEGGLRLLRIWLERSHDALLHYFVDDLTSHSRQALRLLLDHQDRWKNMGMHLAGLNYRQRIRITALPAAEHLLVELGTTMNTRENLFGEVTFHDYGELSNSPLVAGLLFTFPSSVTEATHPIAPHLTKLRLNFDAKRHVYLRLFTMPLFQQCPSLEHLEIDFIPTYEHELDEEPAPNITLPSLLSLQFFTKYTSCTYFLRRLDMPNLQHLDFETYSIYVEGAQRRVIDDVLDVVRKTASTFRELRFVHDDDDNDFYEELLPLIQDTTIKLDVPHAQRSRD